MVAPGPLREKKERKDNKDDCNYAEKPPIRGDGINPAPKERNYAHQPKYDSHSPHDDTMPGGDGRFPLRRTNGVLSYMRR
jgi:hypothetical protein